MDIANIIWAITLLLVVEGIFGPVQEIVRAFREGKACDCIEAPNIVYVVVSGSIVLGAYTLEEKAKEVLSTQVGDNEMGYITTCQLDYDND